MIIEVPFFSGENLRLKLLKAEGEAVCRGDEIFRIECTIPGSDQEVEVYFDAHIDGILHWIAENNTIVYFEQVLGSIE